MGKITNSNELLLYYSLKGLHLLEQTDKRTVLRDMIGIQSQFSGYAQNSLRIRANDYSEENWNEGIARIWSHRGTMHIVAEEEIPLHLAAAGYQKEFVDDAWGISKENAERWAPFIVSEIQKGNNTRNGIKEACLKNGMPEEVLERVFYGWGGLIYEMTFRGMIAGIPGNQKAYRIPGLVGDWPGQAEAREEMVRRYFRHFGPATTADCKYFFGRWKAAELNPILQKVLPDLYETNIDGKHYYSDEKPAAAEEIEAEIPECILVPGFDQLVLGYKDRDRMIDREHRKKLTNISGIVCPTIIVRNRMRAKWKIENGIVTITPFEKLLKKDETAIKRKVKAVFGRKTMIAYDNTWISGTPEK